MWLAGSHYWRSYRSAMFYVIEIIFKHSNMLFSLAKMLFIRHSSIVTDTFSTSHMWHGSTQIWYGNRIRWFSIWHRTTITTHFRGKLMVLCDARLQLGNLVYENSLRKRNIHHIIWTNGVKASISYLFNRLASLTWTVSLIYKDLINQLENKRHTADFTFWSGWKLVWKFSFHIWYFRCKRNPSTSCGYSRHICNQSAG